MNVILLSVYSMHDGFNIMSKYIQLFGGVGHFVVIFHFMQILSQSIYHSPSYQCCLHVVVDGTLVPWLHCWMLSVICIFYLIIQIISIVNYDNIYLYSSTYIITLCNNSQSLSSSDLRNLWIILFINLILYWCKLF